MQISSALRSAIRPALHGVFGHTSYPSGAILHFDADIDPYAEQTGGPHTFNHAVLSPQYQRNADGSYSNVGAKPAVDTFDGERWLRSCGAITNMLTNSVFAGAVSGTPGTAPTGWTLNNNTGSLSVSARELSFSVINQRHSVRQNFDLTANTSYNFSFLADCDGELSLLNILTLQNQIEGSSRYYVVDGTVQGPSYVPPMGLHLLELVYSIGSTAGIGYFVGGAGAATSATGTVTISNPQLTATSYPLPYVPTTTTGPVTQPASNATTTNGMWFALPDGSELWHALDGGPETDGVELVANGVYKLKNAEVVRDTITLTGASNEVSFSGMDYNIGTIAGQRYVAHISGVASVLTANETVTIRGLTNIGVIKSNEAFNFQHQFTATANYNAINIYGNGVGNIVITNVSVQRIQPQPLTLATRVRMGVGSGDLAVGLWQVASVTTNIEAIQHFRYNLGGFEAVRSHCGSQPAVVYPITAVPRNSVIRRFTQVSADGTQFRVGYMIEGTNTAIQWGAWYTYDRSFNPSALYRLILGYNNAYPMWFNKITAWKKQATDAEILEAMA